MRSLSTAKLIKWILLTGIFLFPGLLIGCRISGPASISPTLTTEMTPGDPTTPSALLPTKPVSYLTPSPQPSLSPLSQPIAPTEQAKSGYSITVVLDSLVPLSTVHTLNWHSDGEWLRYAVGDGASTEAKDWQWWDFHVDDGLTKSIRPPESKVSIQMREALDLCIVQTHDCWNQTSLYESPSGLHFVYQLPGATGEFGTGEMWYMRTDGTRHQRIPGQFGSGVVYWSSREDHFIVDVGWDWPEPLIVDVQSLVAKSLFEVVSREPCLLPHTVPRFSPDGERITFSAQTSEEGNCAQWIVHVEGANIEKISDHVGSVTWSDDGQALYILEHRYDIKNQQWFALYRVDLTSIEKQPVLLADTLSYYGFLSSGFLWAVGPDEQSIAYLNTTNDAELCIVHFDNKLSSK